MKKRAGEHLALGAIWVGMILVTEPTMLGTLGMDYLSWVYQKYQKDFFYSCTTEPSEMAFTCTFSTHDKQAGTAQQSLNSSSFLFQASSIHSIKHLLGEH